jgi:hypothetical protein
MQNYAGAAPENRSTAGTVRRQHFGDNRIIIAIAMA